MTNIVREKLEAYFASLNSTSNRMMEDIITSRKMYSDKWDDMQPEEQSDILWKSIVKPEILTKYNDLPSTETELYYFPVLSTRPGAKIICDEDTASAKSFVSGSTWHDEHSAPFRWETQSQIDFRLNDNSEKEGTLNRTDSHKVKSLPRDMPKPDSEVEIRPEPESHYAKLTNSPKPERRDARLPNSPKSERYDARVPNSPKPERHGVNIPKSPKPQRHNLIVPGSPKPERHHDMIIPKSPKLERHDLKVPKSPKKEDDVKRLTIKRPEVPPPPVPPHSPPPPVPPHIDSPPIPPHTITKKEKGEIPIYAKVVKRKSANSKTLMISELKAHRKAKEEMKPAVPPRMSLELKGSMDLTKYSVQTIDIDGIPKTGFDFLDNW